MVYRRSTTAPDRTEYTKPCAETITRPERICYTLHDYRNAHVLAVPGVDESLHARLGRRHTNNTSMEIIDPAELLAGRAGRKGHWECRPPHHAGTRDKAILLLLARLGLRAGDVLNLRLADLDWNEGRVKVCGKGRRETWLPLPQEVGAAILSYLKRRPVVAIDRVFLSVRAPCRPLHQSSPANIVRRALRRAGIEDAPSTGATLLRHSAATSMLRAGASLEGVSAMLRHRSLDMTVYYAKVDVPMLRRIAQP
jgi:integrase